MSYSDAILALNPRIYYKFDELSGVVANDLGTSGASNPNDGTFNTEPIWGQPSLLASESLTTSCQFGQTVGVALPFVTDVRIYLGNSFTFIGHVKLPINSDPCAFALTTNSLTNLYIKNGNLYRDILATELIASGLPDDIPYQLIVTYDAALDLFESYVDSVLVGTSTYAIAGDIFFDTIGYDSSVSSRGNFTLQHYAFLKRKISLAEINTIYQASIASVHVGTGGITFSGPFFKGIAFSGGAETLVYTPGVYTGIGGFSLSGSSEYSAINFFTAKDELGIATHTSKIDPYIIYDAFMFKDKASRYKEFFQQARDSINYQDTSIASLVLRLTDSLQVISRSSNHKLINALAADVIVVVALAVNQYTQFNQALDTFDFTDVSSNFLQFISLDTVDITDSAIQLVSQILRALSGMVLQDRAKHLVTLWCIAPDSINLDSAVFSQHELRLIAQDTLLFVGLMDGEFNQTTYVLNSLTKGLSTYEDFSFNSYSDNLLCKADGIYKREKSLPVNWRIKTGLSDLGSEKQKQVPYVYLGITNSGSLVLKTVTNLRGVKKEVWYKKIQTKDAIDTTRVQLGKGVKSKYWQFELMGDGTTELESLELTVLELGRRI